MIELVPIAGMIFSLLLALIIGGFVLMYPLTRRLGQLIELRLEERRTGKDDAAIAAALNQLRMTLESIQREVSLLQERQDFTDRLLESEAGRGAAGPSTEPGGQGDAKP